MRWLTNFYNFRFKSTATAAIGIHPDCYSWWFSKMQSGREDTLEERYAIKFCFKLGKIPQKRMECFRLFLDHLAWIEHQFLSGIKDQGKPWVCENDERCGKSKEFNRPELIGQRVRVRVNMLRFKGVQKEFLGKRPALFKSGQWHFHKDNAPVHNSILVTDYLTKMAINTVPQPPCSPDLAPCDFSFLLSSEADVMKQLRDERGCDEGHWLAHTRDLHEAFQKWLERYNKSLHPEEITSKGDLSFMCVLSIKVPIRKKSLELI